MAPRAAWGLVRHTCDRSRGSLLLPLSRRTARNAASRLSQGEEAKNRCSHQRIDPECWDHVLPFEARLLEALQVNRVSEPSELQIALSNAFDQIDEDGDGIIGRSELEHLMRNKVYPSCPPEVWALTPDQLLERLGSTGQQISRAEFITAVESIADTIDRRVWPLATSQFFSALMFALSQPLMPLLVRELGVDMASFGGMVAVMPLMRVVLAFPSTFLANRFGRKPLMVEGQLVAAAGFGLSAFIASPWQLVVSRVIIGAGTSFAGVGQQNMLGDIATGRTRSRVFAPGSMRASAAFAVGPALGGWLAATFGVQTTYLMIGAGMAVVSLRNRFTVTETLQSRSTATSKADQGEGPRKWYGGALLHEWYQTSRVFAKDPYLRAVTLANAGFNFTSISSKFVLLPMLALDSWGLGAAQLGMAMGAMSLAQVVAAKPAAYVADIYGRKCALVPGLALTAASMALAASGLATNMAMPLVCGGWALGTSLVGSVPSALTLDAAARCQLDQREIARALAISRAVGDLGMMAGAVASGVLLSYTGATGAFAMQASALFVVTIATTGALRGKL